MTDKAGPLLSRYFAHRLAQVLPPKGKRAERSKGQMGVNDLARAIGIDPPVISEIRNGTRGVGRLDRLKLFASYFGFESLDAAEDAARKWAEQEQSVPPSAPAPATSLELDDRYPNRAKAVDLARGYLSDAAIELVKSNAYDFDDDPPAGWWYERIQAAESELKMLRRDPGKVDRDAERRRAALEEIKRSQGDGE